jgi:hypothetical protein
MESPVYRWRWQEWKLRDEKVQTMVTNDKSVDTTRFLRSIAAVTAACAMLVSLGCGGQSGPKRFDVTGKVTLDGSPLTSGQVIFEPDAAAGNRGPAGYAEIDNGEYNTAKGKGTVGGAHIVRIRGESGANLRIREYETRVDLGSQSSTQDFDVPGNVAETFDPSSVPAA